MPTGYTNKIVDGQSFNDFLMGCARNFGALEFKPSEYHSKRLEETNQKLQELQKMTLEQKQLESQKEYEVKVQSREKSLSENTDLVNKYNAMLKKAMNWTPPSPDHEGLKTFMIEQITRGRDFDDMTRYYKNNPIEKLSLDNWCATQLGNCLRDIEYHTKDLKEEFEKCAVRTLWVKQLRNSIK